MARNTGVYSWSYSWRNWVLGSRCSASGTADSLTLEPQIPRLLLRERRFCLATRSPTITAAGLMSWRKRGSGCALPLRDQTDLRRGDRADPGAPVAPECGRRSDTLEQVRVLAREPDVAGAIERGRFEVTPAADGNSRGAAERRPVGRLTGLEQVARGPEVRLACGLEDVARLRVDLAAHVLEEHRQVPLRVRHQGSKRHCFIEAVVVRGGAVGAEVQSAPLDTGKRVRGRVAVLDGCLPGAVRHAVADHRCSGEAEVEHVDALVAGRLVGGVADQEGCGGRVAPGQRRRRSA